MPAPRANGTVTRAYSIASPPGGAPCFKLVFNRVPNGPGSTFLYALVEGQRVEFRRPTGSFVLHHEPERRLLFVATGTGIAPLRSMILDALPRKQPVTLFWGLRSERDLYFQDDWSELAHKHAEFTCIIALSRPTAAGAVG